jgi:hypothetical protein
MKHHKHTHVFHFHRSPSTRSMNSSSSSIATSHPLDPSLPLSLSPPPQPQLLHDPDSSSSSLTSATPRLKGGRIAKAFADVAAATEHKILRSNQPKFELHLKIHDLNNVPLVSGSCLVKYHFSHSLHAEHRGRTPKSPIVNHRVDFGPYARVISSVRIAVDRSSTLAECPFELEVLQELDPDVASRGEDKIVRLGVVRLNLGEYVEESEAFVRELGPAFGVPGAAAAVNSPGGGWSGSGTGAVGSAANLGASAVSPPYARKRTSSMGTSTSGTGPGAVTPGSTTDSRPTTAVTSTSANTTNTNTNTDANNSSLIQ